jgi:hypothetical protein
MPMTPAELARLEALEARIGAPDPNNADTLTTRVVKVQVAQDSIVEWKDKFALWFSEVGMFDALVQDVLSRVPKPQPASTEGGAAEGLAVGEAGLVWLKSISGVGIAFESDTNAQNGQRGENNTHRQIGSIVISDDAGIGIHQNVVWPEDGGRAWIPDPTRFGTSWRLDRQGMQSVNLYRAGAQFAPNKWAVIEVDAQGRTRKGQLLVFLPEETGNVTLRLPQGGKLYIEEGEGNDDRANSVPVNEMNGHRRTRSRREVMLGPDIGSPAIGGLPGGGGT